ncbi:DUF4112 domain-containing protein [Rhodobacteraceae bacterium KMM 6894]|nr:DUF4112 domain-containing protein [Rhodobacteraceae bacterium KMM 6894]
MNAPNHTARLDHLDRVAHRMDSAFGIPGTRFRIGWDSVLGLVPGVGDTLALAPSAYILYQAHRMGAPKRLITRMMANSGFDFMVGLVPLIGDVFDMGVKSNIRNVALLRAHTEKGSLMQAAHGRVTDDAISVR